MHCTSTVRLDVLLVHRNCAGNSNDGISGGIRGTSSRGRNHDRVRARGSPGAVSIGAPHPAVDPVTPVIGMWHASCGMFNPGDPLRIGCTKDLQRWTATREEGERRGAQGMLYGKADRATTPEERRFSPAIISAYPVTRDQVRGYSVLGEREARNQ